MDLSLNNLLSLEAESLLGAAGVALITWLLLEVLLKGVIVNLLPGGKENKWYATSVNGGALIVAQTFSVIATLVINGSQAFDILNAVVLGIAGMAVAVLGDQVVGNVRKARIP
jgi:hypothetical protein